MSPEPAISPLLLDFLKCASFLILSYVLFISTMNIADWLARRKNARTGKLDNSNRINARVRAYVREQEALANRQRSWW